MIQGYINSGYYSGCCGFWNYGFLLSWLPCQLSGFGVSWIWIWINTSLIIIYWHRCDGRGCAVCRHYWLLAFARADLKLSTDFWWTMVSSVVPLNYCLWEVWMAVLVSGWFGDTVTSIVVPSCSGDPSVLSFLFRFLLFFPLARLLDLPHSPARFAETTFQSVMSSTRMLNSESQSVNRHVIKCVLVSKEIIAKEHRYSKYLVIIIIWDL